MSATHVRLLNGYMLMQFMSTSHYDDMDTDTYDALCALSMHFALGVADVVHMMLFKKSIIPSLIEAGAIIVVSDEDETP